MCLLEVFLGHCWGQGEERESAKRGGGGRDPLLFISIRMDFVTVTALYVFR